MSPIVDNAELSRYELRLDGAVAFIDYRRIGGRRVLTHAQVPPALRGRGIGAELTTGALELIRAQGARIEARCPYVSRFIDRHPEYHDLLALR